MKTKVFNLIFAKNFRRDSWLRRAVAAASIFAFTLNSLANPTGMTIQSGRATLTINGSQLTINAGNNAVLNWQSFNIAAGETTTFNQPSASSIVWNRINNNQGASQIYGSLHANGVVVLLNSSGFYFGPNSFVSAAGLVVSTANCMPPQNGGGSWEFNGPPPLASIVNFGTIKIGNGGDCYLIADKVENHGNIETDGGNIGLAAGQTVTLSERPDGRGMSMNVTLPQGSVDNYGNLIADGGTIALNAKVVNQNGLVQANSVQNRNGVIELVAADSVSLGADSKLLAQGDDSAEGSAGGSVTIKAGNNFSDTAGSVIKTTGGAHGGNGGNVEISAVNISAVHSKLDASAQAGYSGGKFLLDPVDVLLGVDGVDVTTAFAGFSSILVQASGNITLESGTVWDLSGSTGVNSGTATLQAGGDIIFNSNSLITDANNWSLNLMAGMDPTFSTVQSGVGNIYLNGGAGKTFNGAIQLAQGNVNLTAGNNILVGGGYVRTVGGGSIMADALAGSVNTGTLAAGYTFQTSSSAAGGYSVSSNLGGMSTAAGGDVDITAGQNVTSLLPTSSKPAGDAGCGAFGSEAGNVTITAGGNVAGHYVVANGTGTITAGGSAGTATTQLALSLVAGGWSVNAGQNIVLQEVRNPNGIFNNVGSKSTPSYHYFDYAPGDYLNLIAGNSVEIVGGNLPRNSTTFDRNIPVILPGILNVNAGPGGFTLDNNLILFPSPQGSLVIKTSGGGGLFGNNNGNLVGLTMSDSAARQYAASGAFGYYDHAPVPLHLNNPTPVTLNIAGDMDNLLIAAPEAAQITVGGSMNNSRFIGQNLHATDVTSITVAGDIQNRNEFTSVSLATAPDVALLSQAYPPDNFYTSLASSLHYDPVTHLLTFQGRMTALQLQTLTSLTIQVLDGNGVPEVDGNGNPILKTVSILDPATANALFAGSQDIQSSSNTGYVIGGGGIFNITARNMDLGTTAGIQSAGPLNNYALANYFTHGADLNVNLSGNLDMFSTSISSYNGGAVNVNVAGNANIGSTSFAGNDQVARGIFSVQKSDVNVITGGDININGSRIAAYDGGNLTVESLDGNIDAGTGGRGSVTVEEVYVDPITRQVLTHAAVIPGSGILATTFPQPFSGSGFPASKNTVGNILVETPNGNVLASEGGIVQLPLNGVNSPNAIVQVLAGYELRDPNGNRLTASSLVTDDLVQGSLAAATPGDLPRTVVLDKQRIQVSTAVWSELNSLLGLSPGSGQVIDLNASANQSGLTAYLLGTSSSLTGFSFQTQTTTGQNINASGSGVIGSNVKLDATGNIIGVIFARNNLDLAAKNNVNVTALAQGNVNANAGGTISGTLVGIGGVNASGSSIDASLLSQNVTASGDTSGAKEGFAQGTAANSTSQGLSNDSTTAVTKSSGTDDDDALKKKKTIGLAQKVGRVTVILPVKKLSEKATGNDPL